MDDCVRYLILRNISFLRNAETTIKEIAHNIDVNRSHPVFNQVMRELISLGYIKVLRIYGNTKILKIIDWEKIWDLAIETNTYKEIAQGIIKNENSYKIP